MSESEESEMPSDPPLTLTDAPGTPRLGHLAIRRTLDKRSKNRSNDAGGFLMKEILDIQYEDYKHWAHSHGSAIYAFDQSAALLTGAGFTVPMVGKLETETRNHVFFGGPLEEKETEKYGIMHMALVLQPSQSVFQAFCKQESEMKFALGAKRRRAARESAWSISLGFENHGWRLSWWVIGDIPAPPILDRLRLSNAQVNRRLAIAYEAAEAMLICANFFKETT